MVKGDTACRRLQHSGKGAQGWDTLCVNAVAPHCRVTQVGRWGYGFSYVCLHPGCELLVLAGFVWDGSNLCKA